MQENEALNGKKRCKGVRYDANYKRNRIRDARVKGKAHKNCRIQNVTEKTLKTVSCKQRNDLGVICFDYMQNLQLPLIPVQDVFYLTQLTVSLFCIHDMRSDKSYFNINPENAAAKSPNEDNCPGQNKNHCRVRFCAALVENERFRKIDRGHSFLPCDRDFAVIKRNLKKYDRLYDLHEYTEIIIASSLKNKFTVHEIHAANNKDILDFNSWWPTYYKKKLVSFSISKFHHFVHDSAKPGVVKASEYINGCIFHSFHIAHAKIAQSPLPVQFPKSPAYKGPLLILESKKQHLKILLEWITEAHKPFYENINSGPTKQRKLRAPK
nr:unnamed protein product [Callosobruchus analis]